MDDDMMNPPDGDTANEAMPTGMGMDDDEDEGTENEKEDTETE